MRRLCITVIAVCAGLILTFGHGRDQSIYSLVAREMLDGRMPYRDAFDFKPPGIFFVYALTRAVFGPAEIGIRIVEVVCMAGTAWGLVVLAGMLFNQRRIGLYAAALSCFVHAQLDFWHTAQPETFGATLTVWGLVLALGASRTERLFAAIAKWLAVGALFGVAGLMKPPLAGVGFVIAFVVVARDLHERLKARRPAESTGEPSSGPPSERPLPPSSLRRWVPLPAVAAGFSVPIVATLAWYASKGALADLRQVLFVFTPEYTRIGWQDKHVVPMTLYGIREWLFAYSSGLLVGLLLLVIFRPKREELARVLTILACIGVHIAGIVMQGKFFPYHWAATFPLTALLAALGYDKAFHYALARGPRATNLFGLGLVAAMMVRSPVPNMGERFGLRSLRRIWLLVHPPADATAQWDKLASVADVDANQNRRVALFIAAHTKAEDPLYIWGFECAIYDLADRPLASRYIYNVPQRASWSAEEMQRALMVDLAQHVPGSIVVEHADVFPMVTGSTDDSAISLYDFPQLYRLLWSRYHLAQRIGDFDVYLRTDDEDRLGLDGPEEPTQ